MRKNYPFRTECGLDERGSTLIWKNGYPLATSEHPFLNLHPRSITSWEQWMVEWRISTTFEVKMGLLDWGMKLALTPSAAPGRLRFYIQCADGWWKEERFFVHKGDSLRQCNLSGNEPKLLKQLAAKAFQMLAQYVLSPALLGTDEMEFLLAQLNACDDLLWFFRIDSRYGIRSVANLGYSTEPETDYLHTARKFAFAMCRYGLLLGRGCHSDDALHMNSVCGPDLIHLLEGLGGLGELVDDESHSRLAPKCLDVLRELAMMEMSLPTNGDPRIRGMRRPKDEIEAAAYGSAAARVSLMYQVIKQGRESAHEA